ncbi:MAG TPA: MFS transporter [Streptosporangiaceae bacterium]|nr:MFS transporter [Streptosporangiaceae bacterium]
MADAADATGSAVRSGAKAGANASRRTTGFIHRVTGASGAARTGLSTLFELTALGGAADMFVTVALAGTIFFSTSVDQARGKVVLFLIVTMAPFAVLAPFIGPFLDRMQTGRKYVLSGTLMARGLLCWGMSAAVNNTLTLLPAAFGVLILQKAYGVVKVSVTPRLLPPEIPLVTANSRSGLLALAGSTAAAGVAALVQLAAGPAWVLRVGTIVYLAAMLLGLRLPDRIDVPPHPAEPPSHNGDTVPVQQTVHGAHGIVPARQALPPGSTPPSRAGPGPETGPHNSTRWRTLSRVGPVVAEAMTVNAVMRAFSGYILFLLAFLLRSAQFGAPPAAHCAAHAAHCVVHHANSNFNLGALAFGLSTGSLAAMAVGSLFRNRAPQLLMFTVLTASPLVAAAAAYFFGLWAAVAVEFAAIFSASLAKLAQDSIVQREIGEEIRSSTFSVSETLNQVANVAGGIAGVAVSMLNNGQAGLAIAAAALAFALIAIVSRRRRRVMTDRQQARSARARA